MPITYTVEIHLKPGRAEDFLRLLSPVLDAMRQETTFLSAVLHRSADDPDLFLLYETWQDARDVEEVQMHRSYRKAYWDELPELLRVPRKVAAWLPMRADVAAQQGGE